MNSLYASLSIIFAEISLILLVICGTLIFFKLRDQRKDKAALTLLTEKLKAGEEERLNVLSIKLQETQGLEGDALTETAKEIHNKEIDFYITTMTIYANRDSDALEDINQKITALAESYAKLGSKNTENSSTPTSDEPNEEIVTLKNEHTRLQQELDATEKVNERLEIELKSAKQEMRETVAEFVSAFSGGRDAAEEKIAQQQQLRTHDSSQKTATEEESTPEIENTTKVEEPLASDNEALATDDSITEIASKEESNSTEENSVPEQPEGDNNPFLSIDEADGNDTIESVIDRTMDDTELNIDLGLGLDEKLPEPPKMEDISPAPEPLTVNNTENLADDDIDAILAASANDDPKPPATSEVTNTEEDLDIDDINAILATSSDENQNEPGTVTEKSDADEEINADDIDAILNDIDFSTVNAMPNKKKEAEKVG